MKTKTSKKNNKNEELRETVCVFRGLPQYKNEVQQTVKRISDKKKAKVAIEKLIERGIALAFAECGEPAPSSPRLQGRYSEKS